MLPAQEMISVLSGIASMLMLGASLWLPLLAALIWGKCDTPTPDLSRFQAPRRPARYALPISMPRHRLCKAVSLFP